MNLRQNEKQKRKLHVAIVLDESGSMLSTKTETISGLNEQLQEYKKNDKIDTTLTLVTFSGPQDVNIRYLLRPISEITGFTDADYNPDGATAMYDGIGKALAAIKNTAKDDDLTNYLVLVVSDGQENASKEFNANIIAEMINERTVTKKWSINYIGANQDLSKISRTLGINLEHNTLTYNNTTDGTQQMWTSNTGSTARYMNRLERSSGAAAVSQAFYSQEEEPTKNT